MKQSSLFDEVDIGYETKLIADFLRILPNFPSVLRYYDEFDDTARSISDPGEKSIFRVKAHGMPFNINFSEFHPDCATILKHVFTLMLANDLSIRTIASYFSKLIHLTNTDVIKLVRSSPTDIGSLWIELRSREMLGGAYMLAKHTRRQDKHAAGARLHTKS